MTQSGSKKECKVLVADDEHEVVDLVKMVLEMESYNVLTAENGVEALAQIRTHLPDMILLDVRMPRMSGLTVLEHLRSDPATAELPVIMLSVVTTYPEVRMALQRGAVAYLPKPFEIKEMSRQVKRILAMNSAQRETCRQQALKSIGTRW